MARNKYALNDAIHKNIKHFYLKKWTAAQIKAELDEVHEGTLLTLKILYF